MVYGMDYMAYSIWYTIKGIEYRVYGIWYVAHGKYGKDPGLVPGASLGFCFDFRCSTHTPERLQDMLS